MHAVRRFALLLALVPTLAPAQSVQRDGFDGPQTGWAKGAANAPFEEQSHRNSRDFAHSLPASEQIRVLCTGATQLNPFVHYVYPTKTAPVNDDLAASVWVRSGRPGVQLLARCVIPRVPDPANPAQPLTVLLKGDATTSGGSTWQRLSLPRPVALLKNEQQMLRARTNKDLDIGGAYVDQLVLNVFTGPGVTELWVDDLDISPVLEPANAEPRKPVVGTPTAARRADMPEPVASTPKTGAVPVEFVHDQLRVGGHPFVFRGIRWSDAPLGPLRSAGINTLIFDEAKPPTPRQIEEAVREGFWVVPSLSIEPKDAEGLSAEVNKYLAEDAVLFWYLGGGRAQERLDDVARTAAAVRALDPQRPIALHVWDGLWPYSRHADLLGFHRWPLLTGMELGQYRDALAMKRQLARPDKFMWTWVQTHLPDWYLKIAYPEAGAAGFSEPIGPQGEQIRLLTYLSLAAGCKGIVFWSDRWLADSHNGQDRLLTVALLNQELQMLEPMLLGALGAPQWIDTSNPAVKAAVIRCERGTLVLPIWMGPGSQFVPGQAAVGNLTIDVPSVPNAAQAWEVTPGEVVSLQTKRVPGATRVTLREFGLTTAIAFTADNAPTGILVRWQEQVRRMGKMAAQWSYQLAVAEIAKAETVQKQLETLAPAIPDAAALQKDSHERLDAARRAWEAGDYRLAYRESQRSLRPVRILMRAQWEQAVKPFDAPVSSPYAVGYYTLPKHWQFWKELQAVNVGGNTLPDGDFERSADVPAGWQVIKNTLDDVTLNASVVPDDPKEGKNCLKLTVAPKPVPQQPGAKPVPTTGPAALERTFLSVASVPCQFAPNSLVRISGWVKVPAAITASPDGALFYDSCGGEPLAIRLTQPTPWRKFSLYRRVPSTGIVQVTMAMTGVGTVCFDDVRVEPLQAK